MASRKKNSSMKNNKKKNKNKNKNSMKNKKKNKIIVSSQNDVVAKFSQLRLNKKGKGSNSDQLDKDFLKMDVAQLRDPAYPLGGLPFAVKFLVKKAIALMEELEEKPGDLSLRRRLLFSQGQLDRITPALKSMGYLPRNWDFDNMDLPSARFLVA